MFAVIKTGGKQYRVQTGDVIEIEKLNEDQGKKYTFDKVLLVNTDEETLIGTPYLKQAQVKAEVLDNFKGEKVIIFKKKKRKRYQKKLGHRQQLTRIKIEEIIPGIKAAPKKAAEKPKEARKPVKTGPEEKTAPRKAAKPEAKKEKKSGRAEPKEKAQPKAAKKPAASARTDAAKTKPRSKKVPEKVKTTTKTASKAKKPK